MKNEIKIRQANFDDAIKLSQLTNGLSHYYLQEKVTQLPQWLAESFSETQFLARLQNKDFLHFVAEIDNQIFGFIAIKQPNHLYHLFVAENYHGQGVGKQLWQHACETLQLDKQDDIIVRASLYAVPIYQKFGFEATDDISEKDGLKFLAMKRHQKT